MLSVTIIGKYMWKRNFKRMRVFFSKSYFRINILPYFEVWEGFFPSSIVLSGLWHWQCTNTNWWYTKWHVFIYKALWIDVGKILPILRSSFFFVQCQNSFIFHKIELQKFFSIFTLNDTSCITKQLSTENLEKVVKSSAMFQIQIKPQNFYH